MISNSHPPFQWNRLVRRAGEDRPAGAVLRALSRRRLPVQLGPLDRSPDHDHTLIDIALDAQPSDREADDPPQGMGFAGLTPQQRYQFLDWLQEPRRPAPVAFRQLYLAHLEVRLLENKQSATTAVQEMHRLQGSENWQADVALARALLLGLWLNQDAAGLVEWGRTGRLPCALTGVALGLQALMHAPLDASQLPALLSAWGYDGERLPVDLLALRLNSLESNAGGPILDYALAQSDDPSQEYRPWRCSHRDLRLSIPQPDLRRVLEPLLAEMIEVDSSDRRWQRAEGASVADPQHLDLDRPADDEATELETMGWRLILEFGQSRSEYFPFALDLLRRMPTYSQIMDENRTMIHRALFRQSDMKRFWRIWHYVQNWSTTRVYVNGHELQSWQVWPYSQYLR